MSNQQRDAGGKYSAAAAISSGTDPAQRGPGANIAVHTPADTANAGGMQAASSLSRDDDPGNLHAATAALVNRPAGGAGKGGGMPSYSAPAPTAPPGYAARYRSLGLSSNETAGMHQIRTPEGPGNHSDVPPGGMPGPADDTPTGGVPAGGLPGAGAGDAAAGAELADLAPLALL